MNMIPQERQTRENGGKPEENGIRILDSRDLFQGSRELCIEHGEFLYRLRITRQGKLILNK